LHAGYYAQVQRLLIWQLQEEGEKISKANIGRHAEYREYLVETYIPDAEQSCQEVRVRPLEAQGLPVDLKVRCSVAMRENHDIGTVFKIFAKLTNKEGGTPFLHSPYTWDYEVLTKRQAKAFLSRKA
jgi:hypothetical protein